MDLLMSQLSISEAKHSMLEDGVTTVTRQLEGLSVKDSVEQVHVQDTSYSQNPGSPQFKVGDGFTKTFQHLCASRNQFQTNSDSTIYGSPGNTEVLSHIAYSPDTRETFYLDQNKLLFYSYVERTLRQGRALHPACFK